MFCQTLIIDFTEISLNSIQLCFSIPKVQTDLKTNLCCFTNLFVCIFLTTRSMLLDAVQNSLETFRIFNQMYFAWYMAFLPVSFHEQFELFVKWFFCFLLLTLKLIYRSFYLPSFVFHQYKMFYFSPDGPFSWSFVSCAFKTDFSSLVTFFAITEQIPYLDSLNTISYYCPLFTIPSKHAI